MNILNKINSSNDVKLLRPEELEPLCEELREYILDTVSKNGGHLASNLGSVELTVALHRVYDTKKDRIVFYVGHQSYAHKILTGRRDEFTTLRCHNGLSGFPKPYEADDDAFVAGHASNSISVALGMAKARTLNKENYSVAAVIGDGALTGGLAYEGLVNVGGSNEPMVIILNDNGMSINGNVGAIARVLSRERLKPGYINFKRWYRNTVGKMPSIYNANHKVKEYLKKSILQPTIFDSMGIYYLGPVDGHDVEQLETVIRWAKELDTTVLVHVLTKKGKGVEYAEAHPENYHGVGKFNPETGKLPAEKPSFSAAFGNALCKIAEENSKVVAITAAMSAGTGLVSFSEKYPGRFFDVGIAEQNAAAMAAGMAKQGLVPVFAVYSSFLQRAYDMLIHDVSLQKLHTVFCVDRAGLVGNDGETHHGVFDVNYLSSVPGMKILCPSSFAELEYMLGIAVNELDGPVAIRYPRGGEGTYKACSSNGSECIREGTDITVAAYGLMINSALELAEKLEADGISAEILKINQLPFDSALACKSLRKTGRLLVPEDVCAAGCVGEQVLAAAAENGIVLKGAELCNLGEGIVTHGTVDELRRDCGLDVDTLYQKAVNLVRGEK